MRIQILNRLTRTAIWTGEAAELGDAALAALASGADLRDADLGGAIMRDADLRDAKLRGSDLSGADLRRSDLRSANLCEANLSCANLRESGLSGANLLGAVLADADLSGADLSGTHLEDANMSGADLSYANLNDANLRGANLGDVPVVVDLDLKVEISTRDNGLEMGNWHTCETTHCRAGWAIRLAGDAGRALEDKVGSAVAGTLIYFVSTGRVPDFYVGNTMARADIIRCAENPGSPPVVREN